MVAKDEDLDLIRSTRCEVLCKRNERAAGTVNQQHRRWNVDVPLVRYFDRERKGPPESRHGRQLQFGAYGRRSSVDDLENVCQRAVAIGKNSGEAFTRLHAGLEDLFFGKAPAIV